MVSLLDHNCYHVNVHSMKKIVTLSSFNNNCSIGYSSETGPFDEIDSGNEGFISSVNIVVDCSSR